MNPFHKIRRAVAAAETTLLAADLAATDLARLLCGRLRRVNASWLLIALKKELRSYDARTRSWRDVQ